MTRRALALAGLILLGAPAAEAHQWVMWKWIENWPETAEPFISYGNPIECEADLRRFVREAVDHYRHWGQSVRQEGPILKFLLPNGNEGGIVYRCVPDTVDPRPRPGSEPR